MTWFEAIIIVIVEGLTEFLPVSSTGHMIITQGLLGMHSDEFIKAFTVIIQFGYDYHSFYVFYNYRQEESDLPAK